MLGNLFNLSRVYKQAIMICFDSIILLLIPYLSFVLRLNTFSIPVEFKYLLTYLLAPLIAIPIFIHFGLYRAILRYIGFKFLLNIFYAILIYVIIWSLTINIISIESFPRSVYVINFLLTLVIITGSRLATLFLFNQQSSPDVKAKKNILIYGAGNAGIQLLASLSYAKEFNVKGIIDDSFDLQGKTIRGYQVYSPSQIDELLIKKNISEVFFSITSIKANRKKEIIDNLSQYDVRVKLLPGIKELVNQKIDSSVLREIELKDLLGRDPVRPDKKLLGKNIKNKVVLVTGAGGSIGSELCRQIINLNPKELVLYEVSEYFLYSIEKELIKISKTKKIKIYSILGDVRNYTFLNEIFSKYKPNTVYHSAAYKHVPLVENNICQGVDVNVFGSINCVKAAITNQVEILVFISTDKAVRPTNVMGASKSMAEKVVLEYSTQNHKTKISIVRFGNVIGSSGSVIPLFKEQIKNGGPLTVTHKNITRFFMTIPEAVELVIQAGALGVLGGDIFVLDMGNPVKIDYLAKKMINLSGMKLKNKKNPTGDISIKYIGLRPGEKMYEELYVDNMINKTSHPRIYISREKFSKIVSFKNILKSTEKGIQTNNSEVVLVNLSLCVKDFKRVKNH